MDATPSARAARDLEYIRDVIQRTERRVDPHAFHYVHWGAIVLVWYPLSTWLERRGDTTGMALLGAGALLLGALLSVAREVALSKRPRLVGENTFLSRQMAWITGLSIGAGVILSAAGPALGFVPGEQVPTIWGLVYANMAVMLGVVYRRAFLWAGVLIFLAALAAMAWPGWNGFILGPAMGLGLLVPGLQAERRVRRLARDG